MPRQRRTGCFPNYAEENSSEIAGNRGNNGNCGGFGLFLAEHEEIRPAALGMRKGAPVVMVASKSFSVVYSPGPTCPAPSRSAPPEACHVLCGTLLAPQRQSATPYWTRQPLARLPSFLFSRYMPAESSLFSLVDRVARRAMHHEHARLARQPCYAFGLSACRLMHRVTR